MLSVMILGLIEQGLNSGLREAPATRIQRLLLAPDDRFSIGVHVEVFLELCPRERIQLFNASNGGVLKVVDVARTMLVQGSVDLASAQNDPFDFLRRQDGIAMFWIRDDPLEVRVSSEVLNRGSCKWVTEQGL